MNILEIIDKSGRKIYLTNERWSHIRKKHPEVEDLEEVKLALRNPDKIAHNYSDESVRRYYKYFKNKKLLIC